MPSILDRDSMHAVFLFSLSGLTLSLYTLPLLSADALMWLTCCG